MPSGITIEKEDIIAYDGTDLFVFFDGSDVGLGNMSVDAISVISANEILISFDSSESIPGIGEVEDSDIVKFTATQLGDTTSGTFQQYFDGSDVALSGSREDVNALDVLADGRLVISTVGSFSVPGVSGRDEDLIAFTPTTLGDDTTGTWELYFDGSDVDLGNSDVTAFAVDAAGNLNFSSANNFTANGLTGGSEDVFSFAPSSLGENTTGSYGSTLTFDGSMIGLSSDTNLWAIDISTSTSLATDSLQLLAMTSPITDQQEISSSDLLDADQTAPTVKAAIDLSVGADLSGGFSRRAQVQVTDLSGGLLGTANHGLNNVEVSADGNDWFIDATSLENSEFAAGLQWTSLVASFGSPASPWYDRLTVTAEEMGHLLSFHRDDVDQLISRASLPDVRGLALPVLAQDNPLYVQHMIDHLLSIEEEWLLGNTNSLVSMLKSPLFRTLHYLPRTHFNYVDDSQDVMNESHSFDRQDGLAVRRAVADQVFADFRNHRRVMSGTSTTLHRYAQQITNWAHIPPHLFESSFVDLIYFKLGTSGNEFEG